MKEKRKRLQINRIQDGEGIWFKEEEKVVDTVIQFYKDQFSQEEVGSNFLILNFLS